MQGILIATAWSAALSIASAAAHAHTTPEDHAAAARASLTRVSATTVAQTRTADVAVEDAWARPSVQGQSGTGAFMRLTAREPLSLVGASTPVAAVAEVHEMKMEGDVMRMRPVPALELPAGKPVELKPGGLHLMLMQLKAPLKPDARIPMTLTFRSPKGEMSKLEVSVPVAVRAPQQQPHAGHKH